MFRPMRASSSVVVHEDRQEGHPAGEVQDRGHGEGRHDPLLDVAQRLLGPLRALVAAVQVVRVQQVPRTAYGRDGVGQAHDIERRRALRSTRQVAPRRSTVAFVRSGGASGDPGAAGRGRAPGGAVPPVAAPPARRVRRGRRLLRDQRLPDHLAPAARGRPHRVGEPVAVLGPPDPAAAAGGVRRPGRLGRRRARSSCPRLVWQQFFGEILGAGLYVENWVLAVNAVDYLAAENAPSPAQHYWTLSAEEQFYLVWPLLVLLGIWLASRRLRGNPQWFGHQEASRVRRAGGRGRPVAGVLALGDRDQPRVGLLRDAGPSLGVRRGRAARLRTAGLAAAAAGGEGTARLGRAGRAARRAPWSSTPRRRCPARRRSGWWWRRPR